MTRYYFDLRDGDIFIEDAEGLDLLDIAEAQIEAAEFLGDMVKDISMREAKPAGYPMSVEVRQANEIVLVLGFTFPKS
jgi:hypothetical protein